MAQKNLCEVDSDDEDNTTGANPSVVAVRKRGVLPTDSDCKLKTSASNVEEEIPPTKGKWQDIIGSEDKSDNEIELNNKGQYNGTQVQTSPTRLTNPHKSPMIQTPAKTGAASSSHPADAVGASALISIQKGRQNKRTIERYRLPTKKATVSSRTL